MTLKANEDTTAAPAVEATIALTYDDILLKPRHSNILPSAVDVRTQLTRNITLNVPIISAAMDTVTEYRFAIAIAEQGGLGIIHKNMSIQHQAEQVRRVKKFESCLLYTSPSPRD